MWSISFEKDPLDSSSSAGKDISCTEKIDKNEIAVNLSSCESAIVKARVNIKELLSSVFDETNSINKLNAFEEGGKSARTTLAHLFFLEITDNSPYLSDQLTNDFDNHQETNHLLCLVIEPLHFMRRWKKLQQLLIKKHDGLNGTSDSFKQHKPYFQRKQSTFVPPYIMERTDVWCDDENLYINLAMILERKSNSSEEQIIPASTLKKIILKFLQYIASKVIQDCDFLAQIANTVLQHKLRSMLQSLNAVAFIANGSIMPRKSGASFAPMSVPPAIPFIAPGGSNLKKQVHVQMDTLAKYVKNQNVFQDLKKAGEIIIVGMVIPKGISLIVGGGYHGKSTMLRAVMAGVYDKILGDGRELCVTDVAAVSVRAEDGRYVNNTNVSAFISNLPINGLDTKHFSTKEASGSTSQASNVADAIEMGASALLVDEDVSAANFMSRDGRMRALVMDESITPLLYRVNGLYDKHGISSVVVVGGVGDWLDVPNAVIRMEKYVASDALDKAISISRQFSHGHVQYGGRGVVHRLEWDSNGTPFPRRPLNVEKLIDLNNVQILLLDSGKFSLLSSSKFEGSAVNELWAILGNDFFGESYDEDKGTIDMTRCEQILAGKHQLYGCAICTIWLLKAASENSSLCINQLLDKLDKVLDSTGFEGVIRSISPNSNLTESLLKTVGYSLRPRRYEIMMALSRMRGIQFEALPLEDKIVAELKQKEREEEEKRRTLAELWANRRKK